MKRPGQKNPGMLLTEEEGNRNYDYTTERDTEHHGWLPR